MSSENSSSPWNVAPASSPESASPWAVSPFQTSNPFKSPVTSSSSPPEETEPEPDAASYAVAEGLTSKKETMPIFAAAFEPAKEAEKPAASSSAWTVSPVAEAKETVARSAWTSAVPVAVEEVKETTSAVVKDVRVSIVEEDAEEVKESIVKREEYEVEEQTEDHKTGVEALQEASAGAWTTAPVQARAESEPVVVELISEEVTIVEEDEVSDESLGDSPVAVKSVREAPAPMVDEFVVLHNEAADEGTSVATSDGSWTTDSVQEEILSVATKVGDTVSKEPKNVTETVESVVDTAVVASDEEPLYAEKAPSEAASAWTVTPVHIKMSEANDTTASPVREKVLLAKVATLASVAKTPEPIAESSKPIVESCEPAEETSKPVVAAPKPIVEVLVAEDAPSTSTWNSTPAQVEVLKDVARAAVDTIEQKFDGTVGSVKAPAEVVVETEKDTLPSSSAWNAAPAQKEMKAAVVEKSTKPVKEAESVEEHVIVNDKTKNVTKATPIVAVKEVVVEAEKDTPPSPSAWNAAPAQKEMKADVVEKHVIVDSKPKNVTKATPVAAIKEVVVEAEKDTLPSSSAWNAAPAQKEMKAAVVEKSPKPLKEAELIQKHVIVDDKPKNVTKTTPIAAVKEVVDTEAVAEDAKIDKKAIANAFDGVASYEVNSVAKPKKAPMMEAAVSRPANAPGACGACGGCSIQ